MPYVEDTNRTQIKEAELAAVKGPGDLNYFITLRILRIFKENPSYATIHALRRDLCIAPKKCPLLINIKAFYNKNRVKVTWEDLGAAAAEAFFEFRTRVGKLYEGKKMILNGDLPEYQELIEGLEKEIQAALTSKQSNSLILPGSQAVPQ